MVGEATSKVTGAANRKSNVALAAATFNERILLPGDVFSYNDTTGSRTAEKGYLMAPVYKGGKSVDEVGGGICQPPPPSTSRASTPTLRSRAPPAPFRRGLCPRRPGRPATTAAWTSALKTTPTTPTSVAKATRAAAPPT